MVSKTYVDYTCPDHAWNMSGSAFNEYVQPSVVIQRRVEDLQLGVESYQKKLNLTKPDTYTNPFRRHDAYTPTCSLAGFIYARTKTRRTVDAH
ncbi:hypothetical protein Tco_0531384 [Tanacetum coccineum]